MIERVTRSLTLLRVFVVLSALVLGVGGLALGSLVASAIRGQAVDDRESALTQYVDGVLGRELVHGTASGWTATLRRTPCAACTAATTSSA